RPVSVAVPYWNATNRSTVVACVVQSTRSGTDVPVIARLPAMPDWAWLGRGSVEATKTSRSVLFAGIACQTLSMVLAMIVVAPIAVANVSMTTRLGPGVFLSVLSAWRRRSITGKHGQSPCHPRTKSRTNFRQFFGALPAMTGCTVRGWDAMFGRELCGSQASLAAKVECE